MKYRLFTAIALGALALTACAPAADRTAAAATVSAQTTVVSPLGTPTAQALPEATVPADAAALVDLAQHDLRQRLGLDENAAVAVRSVTAVDWPDAGLGCPDPNMMYAQVITPGFTIVLAAGGAEYEYHTDQSDNIVLCEEGKPVAVARKG